MESRYSNPRGEEGVRTLEEMNEHHRPLTEWALSFLPEVTVDSILDVGCGGGMMISILAKKYPKAMIVGMDISETSVRYAREYNRELIENKRCMIEQASVSRIPCDDCTFDLVVSCESYFFWPDLVRDMEEACRVVSLGGRIAIISEAYPHPDFEERNKKCEEMCGAKFRSNEYMKALIGSFGFDVEVRTVEENNWVVFIGRKTSVSSYGTPPRCNC